MSSVRLSLRAVCVLLVQVGVAGALSLSVVACRCPDPVTLDQVFLLDATQGPPPDGGSPSSLDCTAAAAGCTPGCKAACDCVVARDGVRDIVAIESCTLVAQSGPPEVEVRYQQGVFCGGD